MAARLVYIIWSHPISHESLRLLLNHPDVEIVGTTTDITKAQEEIIAFKPDTVIVESTGTSIDTETLAIFASCPWVRRIIGFSMNDNKLNVYQREEKTVAKADDLLTIIQNG